MSDWVSARTGGRVRELGAGWVWMLPSHVPECLVCVNNVASKTETAKGEGTRSRRKGSLAPWDYGCGVGAAVDSGAQKLFKKGWSVLLPKSEWLGDARVGVGREVLVPDFGAVRAIGRCDAAKRTLDTSPLFLLVMMDPTKNIFVLFCRAGGAMKRAADTQRRWRRVATDAGVPGLLDALQKLPVAARRPLSKTSRPPSNAPTALRRRVTSPRNRAPPRPKKRGIRQEGRSSCAGWHFGTPMARDAVNTRVFASRKVAMR